MQQDQILDTVYSAAVQPSLWADVLESVTALVGGEQAVLTRLDVEDGTGSAIATNSDSSTLRDYFDYYFAINPLQLVDDPAAYARDWTPRILLDEDLLARERLEASEYYNDFMRRVGVEWGMIVRLGLAGRDVTAISIGRPYARGRFEPEEAERLGWLHPHLIRAAKLGETFGALSGLSAGLSAALDEASSAMMLVDGRARLLHANAAGHRMLSRGDLLSARHGRLSSVNQSSAIALAEAIARAATPAWERRSASTLPLRAVGRRLPLTATVAPLACDGAEGFARGRAVLVSIAEPAAAASLPRDMLVELFALTAAEIRLATALVQGTSLRDIADRHAISVHTVRAQLASIFAKTGTNRQIDLVKLLMGLG